MSKKFRFDVPVELLKAEKEGEDSWQIQGLASTEDKDLQGEVVSQEGLDISVLKAGRGLFNHDHQKGPENIIGQIEDADFIEHDGKKGLMVKGYLFKNQDRAKAYYNILTSMKKGSAPRVHFSVEGKILERDPHDRTTVRKARIEKVALTMDPVNPNTFAQLIKSLNNPNQEEASNDELVGISKTELERLVEVAQKALAAGVGYSKAPEARVGGEAVSKESLESEAKCMTYTKKSKKKLNKSQVMDLIDKALAAHQDSDPLEIAKSVLEVLQAKYE